MTRRSVDGFGLLRLASRNAARRISKKTNKCSCLGQLGVGSATDCSRDVKLICIWRVRVCVCLFWPDRPIAHACKFINSIWVVFVAGKIRRIHFYTLDIHGGRSHYCAIDHTDSVIKATIIFFHSVWVFLFTEYHSLLLVFVRRYFPGKKTDALVRPKFQSNGMTNPLGLVGLLTHVAPDDVNNMQSERCRPCRHDGRTDRSARHDITLALRDVINDKRQMVFL